MTPECNNYSSTDVLSLFEQKPIKLALFSSGLGTIQRGFEISTGRFYNALAGQEGLDVRLFTGSDFPGAKAVWNIGRQFWLSSLLKPFAPIDREKLWKFAYVLEQTTFSFGLLPESQNDWQPDVVWTKEVPLAHVLYEFRRLFNLKYKVIFANGGGFKPKTYQHFDFIQHLHPEAYEEALRYGIPAEKMNVLPNVVPYTAPLSDKATLRKKYNIADNDYVIISVAAWNKHHKRLDYLLDEFQKLQDPRYKLILCGQPEPEGESLREELGELLGDRVRWLTVSDLEVRELLVMSDLFVLCSLYEGLGAALIEAALAGLPVLCHPHGGGKYILQDDQWLMDMSVPGNLSMKIQEFATSPPSSDALAKLKAKVQQRFDEDELSKRFAAMVEQVLYTQPLIGSRAS